MISSRRHEIACVNLNADEVFSTENSKLGVSQISTRSCNHRRISTPIKDNDFQSPLDKQLLQWKQAN
jgi:hypothetical protein